MKLQELGRTTISLKNPGKLTPTELKYPTGCLNEYKILQVISRTGTQGTEEALCSGIIFIMVSFLLYFLIILVSFSLIIHLRFIQFHSAVFSFLLFCSFVVERIT